MESRVSSGMLIINRAAVKTLNFQFMQRERAMNKNEELVEMETNKHTADK